MKKGSTNSNGDVDGSYLPFINSDYEDRKELYKQFDRTVDHLSQELHSETMPAEADARGENNIKFEPMHIKQIKNTQMGKLPSIGRARHGIDINRKKRERDKENDEVKSGLVVFNSKPSKIIAFNDLD